MPEAEPDPTPFWRSPVFLVLSAIALVGLAVRLPSLTDAIYGDELSTYFIVTDGHGPRNVLDFVRTQQEFTPPLFFELSWLTNAIGGSAEALRLPSLLAGIGAIPLTYLIGERTVGRPAGVVGAALVALSPYLIFFSTEARAYMLQAFLVLVSTYALLRASEEGDYRWWILYAAASCAAVYTHYTAVFVLTAQFLWCFLARPGARKALILANLGAAIAFLPWYPSFVDDQNALGQNIIDLVHPFTWANVRTDMARWSISNGAIPVGQLPGYFGVWLAAAGVAIGLVGLALRIREARAWRPSSGLVLVLVGAAAAPLGAAIQSSVDNSVFIPRNLIGSWPFLALAAGALLTSARVRWVQVAAAGLVISAFVIDGIKLTNADYQRPDYEAAANFIEETGRPGDPVVEYPAPTPSAQTPLEAQLAPYGEMLPENHRVFNLTFGKLSARLRERGPGGAGIFAPLRPVPPEKAARRSELLAGSDGKVFLVTTGSTPVSVLRLGALGTQVADFLGALSPRFRLVETRIYPGFSGFTVAVNVFEDSGAPARAPNAG